MKFDLKKPCSNLCPFRTDCLEGWLGEDRAREIADSLERSSFPCHQTTEFDEEGDHVSRMDEQHCAGALIMREHMDQPGQMMRIAERLGLYDRFNLKMDSPVFLDDQAFIDHHTE